MLDAAAAGQDPRNEPMAGVDRLLNERLAPISEFVQSEQQRRAQTAQAERDRAVTVLDRMAQDTDNFPISPCGAGHGGHHGDGNEAPYLLDAARGV